MYRYSKILLNVCFLLLSAITLQGQNKNVNLEKYLVGSVPEVDGKVIFSETLQTSHSKEEIHKLIVQWFEDKTKDVDDHYQSRMLYNDTLKHELVFLVDDELVFSNKFLGMDFATIYYYLVFEIDDQKCDVTIKSIKYKYLNEEKMLLAEEMISDKAALNKQKTKLNRTYDKFRIGTVDMVDGVFDELEKYLNKEKYETILNESRSRRTNNVVTQVDETITEKVVETPVIESKTETNRNTSNKSENLLEAEAAIVDLSKQKTFSLSNFFIVGEDISYVRQLSAISVGMINNKLTVIGYTNNDGIKLLQVSPIFKFRVLYYSPNYQSHTKLVELSKKYEKGEPYTFSDIDLIQLLLENSKSIFTFDNLQIESQPTNTIANEPTIDDMPSVGNFIKTDSCIIIKGTLLE